MIEAIQNEVSRESWTESDESFGWRFGCLGLMGKKTVCDFLDLSTFVVDQLIVKNKLRKGKSIPGAEKSKVLICRKSVLEYAKSIEQ